MSRNARYGNILTLFLLAVFIVVGSIYAIGIEIDIRQAQLLSESNRQIPWGDCPFT